MTKDLTTLDNVKLLLNEEDTYKDDVLEMLITPASEMIRESTGRYFTVPQATEDRVVVVYRERIVYLDETTSDRVIGVKNADGLDLNLDYRILPETRRVKGCYIQLPRKSDYSRFPESHLDFFTTNLHGMPSGGEYDDMGEALVVTALWGYTAVPETLDYLTARTVQLWFKDNIAEYTQTYSGGMETFVVPSSLPTAVEKALDRGHWNLPVGFRK